MAESPAAVFIGEGEELEAMVPMDGGEGVDPLAVQLRGQGGFAQAGEMSAAISKAVMPS